MLIYNTYCHENALHSMGDSPSEPSCIFHVEFEACLKLHNLENRDATPEENSNTSFFKRNWGFHYFFKVGIYRISSLQRSIQIIIFVSHFDVTYVLNILYFEIEIWLEIKQQTTDIRSTSYDSYWTEFM